MCAPNREAKKAWTRAVVSHVPENKTVRSGARGAGSHYRGTTCIGNVILNGGPAHSRLESCGGRTGDGFFRPLRVPSSANGNLACQGGPIGRCLARKARYAIDGRLTFQRRVDNRKSSIGRDDTRRRGGKTCLSEENAKQRMRSF